MTRGFALIIVVASLAVLGLIGSAALFAAVQGSRGQARESAERRALDAAETAIYASLEPESRRALTATEIGTRQRFDLAPTADESVSLYVARLSRGMLWLAADARVRSPRDTAPLARRRISLLVAMRQPAMPPPAAIIAAGALNVAGAVTIDGNDRAPLGWPCPRPDTVTAPGVIYGDTPPVVESPAIVRGMPALSLDTASVERSSLVIDQISANFPQGIVIPVTNPPAGLRIEPVQSIEDDRCITATPDGAPLATNWGDPRRPSACALHLPLINVAGDLVSPTGRGQGVLLIQGDLDLSGDFSFTGVVIVLGKLTTRGTDVRITGALLLPGPGPHDIGGDTEIHRSSCAVATALDALAVPVPLAERAWAEVW